MISKTNLITNIRDIVNNQTNNLDTFERSSIRQIIEALPYPFYIIDVENYKVLLANHVANISGVFEGGLCYYMTHQSAEPCHSDTHPCPLAKVLSTGSSVSVEHSHICKDGATRIFEIHGHPVFNSFGTIDKMIVSSIDITDRKLAEQKLVFQNEKLEHHQKLLEHKNSVIQEMLEQVEQSKYQHGQQLQSNIDKVVLPLLADLEGQANNDSKQMINLIRSVLTEISLPLVDEFEKKRSLLSPREIQISKMISQGHSTKQIASLLSLSCGTIEQQRKRIRRKLGITGNKVNLTSFLSSN